MAGTRRQDEIVKTVEATVAARRVRELDRLRDGLGSQLFEFFLLAGLFAFSIGIVVTIIFALPQDNSARYLIMCMFLLGGLVWVLLALEYLIRRIRVLRRLEEIHLERIERLEKALRRLEKE